MGDSHKQLNVQDHNDPKWITVNRHRRRNDTPQLVVEQAEETVDKINEPCWFFNTGGCRHKDGTEKSGDECKYLHVTSMSVRRPPHLNNRKPCDKYNLEGVCKWNDNCKYSHRNLTSEEWSKFYPGIPYTLKTNILKRQLLEAQLSELQSQVRILEYKFKSMDEYYEKKIKLIMQKLGRE